MQNSDEYEIKRYLQFIFLKQIIYSVKTKRLKIHDPTQGKINEENATI